MTVCVTQWLCPSRHCSIALLWDSVQTTAEQVEQQGEEVYAKGALKRWCGICGGPLTVEHRQSRFHTVEEAEPHFKVLERANLLGWLLVGDQF